MSGCTSLWTGPSASSTRISLSSSPRQHGELGVCPVPWMVPAQGGGDGSPASRTLPLTSPPTPQVRGVHGVDARGALSQLGQLHLPCSGQHQALLLLHHRYEQQQSLWASATDPTLGGLRPASLPHPSFCTCCPQATLESSRSAPLLCGHQHVPCMKPPVLAHIHPLLSPQDLVPAGDQQISWPGLCSALLPAFPPSQSRALWCWGVFQWLLTPTRARLNKPGSQRCRCRTVRGLFARSACP